MANFSQYGYCDSVAYTSARTFQFITWGESKIHVVGKLSDERLHHARVNKNYRDTIAVLGVVVYVRSPSPEKFLCSSLYGDSAALLQIRDE